MNLKNKNWKTTLAGIGVLLASIGMAMQSHFDSNAETVVSWEVLFASVAGGIGLIFAKDGDKSTAQLSKK